VKHPRHQSESRYPERNELTTAAVGLRKILHLRYVRAFIAGVSFAMIVCSAAACVIQLRHDVSFGAVSRYFTRSFANDANLHRELASHLTTAQLDRLFTHDGGVNPGGFVYRHDGALHFHAHATEGAESARGEHRADADLFPRLLERYRAGDLDGLLEALGVPAVRARLERSGVSGAEFDHLARRVDLAKSERERIRILRSMRNYLSHFVPYAGSAYTLSFRDKLLFYEANDPEGEFVGTFEVLGLQLGPQTDDEFGRAMSTQAHHLAILRLPTGHILIKDYYRGRLRTYSVRMIQHPSGRRLFKVA